MSLVLDYNIKIIRKMIKAHYEGIFSNTTANNLLAMKEVFLQHIFKS